VIEVEITSTASFLDTSRRALSGFGRTVYWYRGHASATWLLVPSVHRTYDNVGEHSLMARFRLSAPTRREKCPELRDLAGWICLMQHFGLPTRLLDWTASPLAALYFAVSHEPQPGPAAVWVLVPSELNRASACRQDATLVLTGPEAKPLLEAAFEGGRQVDETLAVVGQDVDLRMTVQQAAFTIHGTDAPLEARPASETCLAKFLIPEAAKEHLAEELWVLGIRRSGLFPDLASLAKDLATDFRMIAPKVLQNR